MTTLKSKSNSLTTFSNSIVHFNKVMSISGSLGMRCGDIFKIVGGDTNTFTIIVGGEELAVCSKTLTASKNGRQLEFKSLITLTEIDSIKVKDIDVLTIGKRYGSDETLATHGKDAVLIQDAIVSINGIDICCYIEGHLSADRVLSSKRRGYSITNILGSVPLIQMTEEVNDKLQQAIIAAYDVSVKKLSQYYRELILEHICRTNPMLRFQRFHIEDMADALCNNPEFGDFSYAQIVTSCQIVINNYDKYMAAYKAERAETA